MKKNNQKGFTLIELIVVMVIIGLLASFMAFNFIEVNKRARDGQRKSDLQQIRSALELYRSDSSDGTYPSAGSAGPNFYLVKCGNKLQDSGGTSTYMEKVPCDPNNKNWNGGDYYYLLDSTDPYKYTLIACLENSNDGEDFPAGLTEPPGCSSGKYYVLTNP